MARNSHEAGAATGESVGLCARCRHAATQRNARHNVFWRCLAADHDERLLRYPPLPVRRCPAYEPADRGGETNDGGDQPPTGRA
jgi:hypothetical protein